jgi:hypothetical protein
MTPSESLLNSPKAQFSLKLELQQVNDYYRLEIPSFLGDSQDESQMRHHLMLPIVDRCRLRHQFDGDHDPIDSMAEWTLNQEQLFRLIFQHQDHSFGSEWILDNHHNHLISVKSIFTQDQIENDSLLKTLPQGNYQLSLIRSL